MAASPPLHCGRGNNRPSPKNASCSSHAHPGSPSPFCPRLISAPFLTKAPPLAAAAARAVRRRAQRLPPAVLCPCFDPLSTHPAFGLAVTNGPKVNNREQLCIKCGGRRAGAQSQAGRKAEPIQGMYVLKSPAANASGPLLRLWAQHADEAPLAVGRQRVFPAGAAPLQQRRARVAQLHRPALRFDVGVGLPGCVSSRAAWGACRTCRCVVCSNRGSGPRWVEPQHQAERAARPVLLCSHSPQTRMPPPPTPCCAPGTGSSCARGPPPPPQCQTGAPASARPAPLRRRDGSGNAFGCANPRQPAPTRALRPHTGQLQHAHKCALRARVVGTPMLRSLPLPGHLSVRMLRREWEPGCTAAFKQHHTTVPIPSTSYLWCTGCPGNESRLRPGRASQRP